MLLQPKFRHLTLAAMAQVLVVLRTGIFSLESPGKVARSAGTNSLTILSSPEGWQEEEWLVVVTLVMPIGDGQQGFYARNQYAHHVVPLLAKEEILVP